MFTPSVSIVVVSQDRPELLQRCLLGISQLFYENFEVIVVSNDSGLAAAKQANLSLKCVRFDEQNISKARNLGIENAAGTIIAFIDDDAVPEPSWLNHLITPFQNKQVQAAGGFVRGRNGLDFQWTSQWADQFGCSHPLEMRGSAPEEFTAHEGYAIKTEGTNCAFRASILHEIGGFDPGFTFFLDETDVNMRLAQRNLITALVPKAQVWHGYAASPRRKANRAPLDLTQIGQSSALFFRKHNKKQSSSEAYKRARYEQRTRLITHMINGTIEPDHIALLLKGFDEGWEKGLTIATSPRAQLSRHAPAFKPAPIAPRPQRSICIDVRSLAKKHQLAQLKRAEDRQDIITVLRHKRLFSAPREHFTPRGYWERSQGRLRKHNAISNGVPRKAPQFSLDIALSLRKPIPYTQTV